MTITQPPPLSALPMSNDTVCTGSCTGVLVFTPLGGGTPPYTYYWSNGQTTWTVTGLCAGSYTANITDANGCTVSESASVVVHSNIPTFTVVPTITNATCAGSSDGSISLACSGPTAPFRFEWQMPHKYYPGNSFNNLSPGTYSVIVTDALYNCTPLSYIVGVNYTCGTVSGKTFNDTNFSCTYNAGEPGINNSYITINPGAYVVYPDNNGNYSQQNLPYGSYTITQTMLAGSPFSPCIATQPVTVSAATPSTNFADTSHTALSDPMISYFYTSELVVGDPCSATFQIVNNGSAFSNGRAFFTMPDSLSLLTTVPAYSLMSNDTIYWNYSGLLPGDTLNYSITCTISKNLSLNGFTTCGVAGVIPSNAESNSGNNTALRCDFIGVPDDPNEKAVYPAGIGPNGYINLTDSVLTYIIRFQNTGSAKATNIYIVDTISSHLDMSTLNVLGASNAFSYTYTGNRVKFTFSNINLPDSIGNQAGSKGWIEYQIHQSKANDTGTVIHNTAYIYFDFNSPVITNTTTNTIGCPLSAPSIAISNVACYGGNTGSATVTPTEGTAPFTYSWSGGGGTNATGINLTAGTYTVNMKDVNGCFATAIATITQPVSLNASANLGSNVLCNGRNDGSLSSTVSGGTKPYTYSWSGGGGSNANASGLIAGIYTLTITDSCGNSATATATVSEPASLIVSSFIANNVSCNGGNDGNITSNVSGGTTPYTYSWSNSQNSPNISGLSVGTYTLSVTDMNGCTSSAMTIITQPNALSIIADSINDNGGCNGSAWAKVNGGTMPYKYAWTGGLTTDTITNQCAGNYCCVATDAKGCIDSVCVGINIFLGAESITSNNRNIKLYPNPSDGKFTIESSIASGQSSLEIYNMLGEKIYTSTMNTSSTQINLGKNATGIYLYRVLTEKGELLGEGKFVIQ